MLQNRPCHEKRNMIYLELCVLIKIFDQVIRFLASTINAMEKTGKIPVHHGANGIPIEGKRIILVQVFSMFILMIFFNLNPFFQLVFKSAEWFLVNTFNCR